MWAQTRFVSPKAVSHKSTDPPQYFNYIIQIRFLKTEEEPIETKYDETEMEDEEDSPPLTKRLRIESDSTSTDTTDSTSAHRAIS